MFYVQRIFPGWIRGRAATKRVPRSGPTGCWPAVAAAALLVLASMPAVGFEAKTFDLLLDQPDMDVLVPAPSAMPDDRQGGILSDVLNDGDNKDLMARKANEAAKQIRTAHLSFAALRDRGILLSAAGRLVEAEAALAAAAKAPDSPADGGREIELLEALAELRNGRTLSEHARMADCPSFAQPDLVRACFHVAAMASSFGADGAAAAQGMRDLRRIGATLSQPFTIMGSDPRWRSLRIAFVDTLRSRYASVIDTGSSAALAARVTRQFLDTFLQRYRDAGPTSDESWQALSNLIEVEKTHRQLQRALFWLDLFRKQAIEPYDDGIEDLTALKLNFAQKYAVVTHDGGDPSAAAQTLAKAESAIAAEPSEILRYAKLFYLADGLDEPAFPEDSRRLMLQVWSWGAAQPQPAASAVPRSNDRVPKRERSTFSIAAPVPTDDEQPGALQFAAGVRLIAGYAGSGDLYSMDDYQRRTQRLADQLDQQCGAPLHAVLLKVETADAIRRFSTTPRRLRLAASWLEEASRTIEARFPSASGETRALEQAWDRIGPKLSKSMGLYNTGMSIGERLRERTDIALGRVYLLQGRDREAYERLRDGFSLFISEYSVGGRSVEQATLATELAQAAIATKQVRPAANWLNEAMDGLDIGESGSTSQAHGLAVRATMAGAAKDFYGAELALARAQKIEERIGEKRNRRLAAYRDNLAGVMLDEADPAAAAALFGQSLRDIDDVPTGDLSVDERTSFGRYLESLYGLMRSDPTSEASAAGDVLARSFGALQRHLASQAGGASEAANHRAAVENDKLARALQRREELARERALLDKRFANAFAAASAEADTAARDHLNAEIEKVDAEIQSQAGGFDRVRWSTAVEAPLTLAEARGRLTADQALVAFDTVGDDVFVWLISKDDRPVWLRAPLAAGRLDEAVATLRCGLDGEVWDAAGARCAQLTGAVRPPTGSRLPFRLDVAAELYEGLFGAIDRAIAGKDLIVVSNGALSTLPLQVLVTRRQDRRLAASDADYQNIPWLGVSHPIWVMPSVGTLRSVRNDRLPGKTTSMIAFGDPLLLGPDTAKSRKPIMATAQAWANQSCSTPGKGVLGGARDDPRLLAVIASLPKGPDPNGAHGLSNLVLTTSVIPLPSTRDQICAMGLALGDRSHAMIYLGAAATKATLIGLDGSGALGRADLVIFATHSLTPGPVGIAKSLDEPGLVLTPAGSDAGGWQDGTDALLTASDIAQMQFRADWVILSACDTASADQNGGEPLSGLARAFLYAGARALLVSQWRVTPYWSNMITAPLLANGTVSKAEALRRAETAMIQSPDRDGADRRPSSWAAFTLIGPPGGP